MQRATLPKTDKIDWDQLWQRFNTPDFIARDPVSFAHAYRHTADWRDAECIAFIAALFSYGRRDKILETLTRITEVLGPTPVVTLGKFSTRTLKKRLHGFYYRFNTLEDLLFILSRLAEIYADQGSLKALWQKIHPEAESLRHSISQFREQFLYGGSQPPPKTNGMKFLLADPLQNSAAKRFNMFLRWMVRQDAVDLGLWADVVEPRELMIPLDTHVAAMARLHKITHRRANDWQTAEEITAYFRKRCPHDPVRYDFALFGLGIESKLSPQPGL